MSEKATPAKTRKTRAGGASLVGRSPITPSRISNIDSLIQKWVNETGEAIGGKLSYSKFYKWLRDQLPNFPDANPTSKQGILDLINESEGLKVQTAALSAKASRDNYIRKIMASLDPDLTDKDREEIEKELNGESLGSLSYLSALPQPITKDEIAGHIIVNKPATPISIAKPLFQGEEEEKAEIEVGTPIMSVATPEREVEAGGTARVRGRPSTRTRRTPIISPIRRSPTGGSGGAGETSEGNVRPVSHNEAGNMSGGDSVRKEQDAQVSQPVNQMPMTRMMQDAVALLHELVALHQPDEQPVPPVAAEAPADELEDAVGQATTESTRQNELASNETATLEYKPNFTEVMDPAHMRLATDVSRGNLGAGTSAQMQSADLWGNQFTQPPQDLPVQPEQFLQTQPGGVTVEKGEDEAKQQDLYSFLPFAKLGGVIVWIPRHVQAARFFFTSDDYSQLTSHVRDGDPLTLDKTEEVDSTLMMSSIIKSYGTLKSFCQLGPMLPMTASIEQIYAEWLEMRQIGVAVGRYQQISGGMYENAELSMKGGIRAAVASALRPFVVAWNQIHTDAKDQIAMDVPAARPGVGIMTGTKRKAQAGVVEPEEYNPQFSFQPVDLKRVKFSIPTV